MSSEGETPPSRGVEFGPAPAAFDLSPVVWGDRNPRALSSRGICHWLSHAQADLTGPRPVHTHRSVVQVTGSDGLQTAARFDVVFNPHHERLIVHAVRVHRAGQTREAASPEAFQVIQRELNLERAVYDGRITAHMVIPDVREGDVVEAVHSIVGANPVLAGLFAWWFVLQWSETVVETRCTLRTSSDRRLTIRKRGAARDPVETVEDGVRVLDWRVVDVAPYVPEPGSPPSWVGFAAVHVADAVDWARVADVFRPHYQPAATLPADLAEGVARIAAVDAAPAGRLVSGLRLVQEALRYHSVGVGEGGYRPRPLEQIWTTRYGDCKDASVALTAVLRALGLEADCALVNTVIGDDLADAPPNATAFDHCIVRVRLDGRSIWLDPTLPPQAGDLNHLTQADFHWALPLVEGAKLEAMPPTPLTTVCQTEEDWTFSRRSDRPAEVTLTTTYRAWRADGMRRWIANEGSATVARRLREGLESEMRSPLRELAPVEVSDDAVGNALTLIERYEVEKPFVRMDDGKGLLFQTRDDVVGPNLSPIGPDLRREPLMLGTPRRVATRRTFRFPVAVQIAPWRRTLDGPAGLRLESAFAWTSKTEGVHTLSLTAPERLLPVTRVDDYRDFEQRALGSNGLSFGVAFRNGKMTSSASKGPGIWSWLFWLFVVGALAAARLLAAA